MTHSKNNQNRRRTIYAPDKLIDYRKLDSNMPDDMLPAEFVAADWQKAMSDQQHRSKHKQSTTRRSAFGEQSQSLSPMLTGGGYTGTSQAHNFNSQVRKKERQYIAHRK